MARPTDPALLLAALPPEDRATVDRWLFMLGMEADELGAVPPLRLLVSMVATLRLAGDMEGMSRTDAFGEAAGALGLSGDSLLRTWYRWQLAAVRQFVTDDEDAA